MNRPANDEDVASALRWLLATTKSLIERKPVRDLDEVFSHCERILRAQLAAPSLAAPEASAAKRYLQQILDLVRKFNLPPTDRSELALGIAGLLDDAAAPAAPVQTKGFVLVPMHPTRAMNQAMDEEGWQWEDLLAAAEAITPEQYDEIVSEELNMEAERAAVEAWANENQTRGPSMDDVWCIYLHGKEAGRASPAAAAGAVPVEALSDQAAFEAQARYQGATNFTRPAS